MTKPIAWTFLALTIAVVFATGWVSRGRDWPDFQAFAAAWGWATLKYGAIFLICFGGMALWKRTRRP